MKAHWNPLDFVVTETYPAYDGKGGVSRVGYCSQCGGDMQSFTHEGKQGPIKHYNSHKRSRARGLHFVTISKVG